MWKCAFCGAMNEDENLVCDGCGDERPMTPQTTASKPDRRLDFEDMRSTPASPPAPSFVEEKDDDEDVEEKDDLEASEPVQADDSEDLDAESEAEPFKADNEDLDVDSKPDAFKAEDKEDDGGMSDFSSDTVISSPSPSQSTPSSSPEPIASYTPPQSSSYSSPMPPSSDTPGQRYSMVFINTPAQSLIKSRVSIEFDDFPVISIGRNPENVVVIPDQEVSRKHAQLSVENGKLTLKDLQSANGTYVYDGKQFQRVNGSVEVKPNSIVKFGSGTIVRLENG